ncbi:MAG: zinc-finger domain-containing protein [Woeseiaceae bacterium]|nr:zinc-finger domain-containing protein [Woeseiaceae bacterium]
MAARAGTVDQNLIQANAEHRYRVTEADLPLSCPMPGMYLWNSHPKVFLPVQETGRAKCPYCGAEYTLEGDS